VTAGGVFLATQQGDRAGTYLLLQPTYTIEERPRTPEQRVVHAAVIVVILLTFGPSAQLTAEKQVPDAVLRQRRFEGEGVEARSVPGIRVRWVSTTTSIPYPFKRWRNLCAEWLEWPMVNTWFVFGARSPIATPSISPNSPDGIEHNPEVTFSPDPLSK